MAELTEPQIRQIIGQLDSSIERIEPLLGAEEFQEYCDSIYTAMTYWRVVLKSLKEDAGS